MPTEGARTRPERRRGEVGPLSAQAGPGGEAMTANVVTSERAVAHGLRVDADSAPRPRMSDPKAVRGETTTQREPTGARILVADDEESARSGVATLLRSA